jgi:fucose permease
MKPQLINKSVLKKLLRKAYNQTDNGYALDRNIKQFIDMIKYNWYYILIGILTIILIIIIYIKKIKKTERMEQPDKSKKKEKFKQVRFVDSPESEYYKMLPRVTNSPEIIPYQY